MLGGNRTKFAVLEPIRKLKDRVIAAEQAIRTRESRNGQVSNEERIAIEDCDVRSANVQNEGEHDVLSLKLSAADRHIGQIPTGFWV